jgi:hypothetical protein
MAPRDGTTASRLTRPGVWTEFVVSGLCFDSPSGRRPTSSGKIGNELDTKPFDLLLMIADTVVLAQITLT